MSYEQALFVRLCARELLAGRAAPSVDATIPELKAALAEGDLREPLSAAEESPAAVPAAAQPVAPEPQRSFEPSPPVDARPASAAAAAPRRPARPLPIQPDLFTVMRKP